MSNVFEYTDSFVPASAAIEAVYYNRNTYELNVVPHGKTSAAGYRAVPAYVYDSFKKSSSKGYYWNTYIKPMYTGIVGGDVFKDINYSHNVTVPSILASSIKANVVKADDEYTVTFSVSGTLTVTGTADGFDDAVTKATKILNENMVGTFKVEKVEKNK